MKIKRHEKSGNLWPWVQQYLPNSLRAEEVAIGYGYRHVVYRARYKRSLADKILENAGDVVADISGTTVELYCPEYFSDFEDICKKFEEHTGCTSTLEYWESPRKSGEL